MLGMMLIRLVLPGMRPVRLVLMGLLVLVLVLLAVLLGIMLDHSITSFSISTLILSTEGVCQMISRFK